MTSEEEERPRFVTGGYGWHRRQWIKGITIGGLETKLLQFTDDTTAVLSDLDSARALLDCLKVLRKHPDLN